VKLTDIPTSELRRIALATERAVGPDAVQVRAMRQELDRRERLGYPLAISGAQKSNEGVCDAR
jgi:hypothetical protein